MIGDRNKGGRGHSFSWFYRNDGSNYLSEPPPDTACRYCGTAYKDITNIHYCPEKYNIDHAPQMVLPGLEGPT